MKYEPYHALINAIILQAVKDYRAALDDENTSGVSECERFFRSPCFPRYFRWGGTEEITTQKSTPAEVERDLYKTLYEQILDKLVGGNTND